jgi:hypothetical protein
MMTARQSDRAGWLLGAALLVASACGSGSSGGTSASNGGTKPVTTCAAGTSPALAAFTLAKGSHTWSYCSADEVWRTVLGSNEDVVLVSSIGKDQVATTVAVDTRSGEALWTTALHPGMRSAPGPIAGGGVVTLLVPGSTESEPMLSGLDAKSGKQKWSIPAGVFAGILANTDKVVVVSSHDGVRGLDRLTGDVRWTSPVHLVDSSHVGVGRAPGALTGNTLVIPADTVDLALDVSTGTQLWQAPELDHPTAAGKYVVGYVGQGAPGSAMVVVLNAVTGAQVWSKPGSVSYGDLWAMDEKAVYVLFSDQAGAQQGVTAYDLATGKQRWSRLYSSGLPVTQPQLSTGRSAVLLWESQLVVLSAADGSTQWQADSPLATKNMSSVSANTTTLFVGVNSLGWSD